MVQREMKKIYVHSQKKTWIMKLGREGESNAHHRWQKEREISCCDTQNEWISKTTNTIE
jgi:hypothetical protein